MCDGVYVRVLIYTYTRLSSLTSFYPNSFDDDDVTMMMPMLLWLVSLPLSLLLFDFSSISVLVIVIVVFIADMGRSLHKDGVNFFRENLSV